MSAGFNIVVNVSEIQGILTLESTVSDSSHWTRWTIIPFNTFITFLAFNIENSYDSESKPLLLLSLQQIIHMVSMTKQT